MLWGEVRLQCDASLRSYGPSEAQYGRCIGLPFEPVIDDIPRVGGLLNPYEQASKLMWRAFVWG